MPHGGLVDHADAMEVFRNLLRRPKRITPVALRLGHISNSLHPLVITKSLSFVSVSLSRNWANFR
jgi:hypothetical protein